MLRNIVAIAVGLQVLQVKTLKMYSQGLSEGSFDSRESSMEGEYDMRGVHQPPHPDDDKKQTIMFLVTGGSHIDPLVPIINKVMEEGHQVVLMGAFNPDQVGISEADKETFATAYGEFLSKGNFKRSAELEAFLLKEPKETLAAPEKLNTWEGLEKFDVMLTVIKQSNVDVLVYDSILNPIGKYVAEAAGIRHISSLAEDCFFDPYSYEDPTGPVRKDTAARLANYIRQKGWTLGLPPKDPYFMSAAGVGKTMGRADLPPTSSFSALSPVTFVYGVRDLEEDLPQTQTNTRFVFAGRHYNPQFDLEMTFDAAQEVFRSYPTERDILANLERSYEKATSFTSMRPLPIVLVDFGDETGLTKQATRWLVEALGSPVDLEYFAIIVSNSAKDMSVADSDFVRMEGETGKPNNVVLLDQSFDRQLFYFLVGKSSLLVSHVDSRSLYEAISLGVPILAFPVGREVHFENARRVSKAEIGEEAGPWRSKLKTGAGWVEDSGSEEDKKAFIDGMREQVHQMLSESKYKINIDKLSAKLEGEGLDKIKDIILHKEGGKYEKELGVIDTSNFFLAPLLVSLLSFLFFTVPAVVFLSK